MSLSEPIIRHLLKKAAETGNYSSDELDMIRYSAQSILWEIEKILTLLIIFTLFGKGWVYTLLILVLLSIRSNAGGYHCKTYYGCLLFTFCIFLFAIELLPRLPVGQNILSFAAMICIINTALFAPVYSAQKEPFMEKPNKKKVLACLITFIWLLILRFFDESFMIPVLYLILLQNFELTITYFIKRRNKRCPKM